MARKRSELEELAYCALKAVYKRPPSKKVAESTLSLKAFLDNPRLFLAYAALRGYRTHPSDELVAQAARSIEQSFPDSDPLVELITEKPRTDRLAAKLDQANTKLATTTAALQQSENLLKSLHEKSKELEEELASTQRQVREGETAVTEARSVAKLLWSSMPPEGKLKLFESDEAWLPRWVRPN